MSNRFNFDTKKMAAGRIKSHYPALRTAEGFSTLAESVKIEVS